MKIYEEPHLKKKGKKIHEIPGTIELLKRKFIVLSKNQRF